MISAETKNKNYLLLGAALIILALVFGGWSFLMKPKTGQPTNEEKKILRQSYLPLEGSAIRELSADERKSMMPKEESVIRELSEAEKKSMMPLAGSEITPLIGD